MIKFEEVNKKRLVIRVALLVLLIALGFGLRYIGKQHEVLLDNRTAEIDGKSYEQAEYMRIVVNGDEENYIEFYAEDRDVVKLDGPSHKIKVTIMDEDSEQVIKTAEREFNFGTKSAFMISLPALADSAPNVYLPLPGSQQELEAEEEEEAAESNSSEVPASAADGSSTNPAPDEPTATE